MAKNKSKKPEVDLMAPPSEEELLLAPPSAAELEATKDLKPTDYAGATQAALMGAGRGVTFGLGDRAGAGVDVLIDQIAQLLPDSAEDAELKKQGFKIQGPAPVSYDEALASRKALAAQQLKEHPYASIGGELAGALATGVLTGPLAAAGAAKVLPGAAKAVQAAQAAKATGQAVPGTLLARTGLAGVEGAGYGAATGVAPALDSGDAGHIGSEAAVGTALSAAFPVVGAAVKSIPSLGRKVMATFLGPSEQTQLRYLANRDAIRGAQSLEDIKTQLDDVVGKIRGDFENAKLTRDSAQQAFNEVKAQIREGVASKRFDAKDALRQAQSALDDAFKVEKEMLKKTPVPIELVDDVLDANRQIKDSLIRESGNATALLSKSAETIEVKPILDQLKDDVKRLRESVSKTDQAAADSLEGYVQRLKEKPAKLTMQETKKLLKELDKDIDYNLGAGEFNETTDLALKNIRGSLDETLKSLVPEYAVAMETKVAPLARLRSESVKVYGTPEKIRAKIMRLSNPALAMERDLLQRVGSAADRDFMKPLESYVKAQKTLASPMALDQLKAGLPEQLGVAKAQQQASKFDKMMPSDFDNMFKQTQEFAQLQQAEQKMLAAQEVMDQFRSFSESNTQAKIQALMGDRNLHVKQLMGDLSKYADKDFVKMIQDMQTASAFDKTFIQGSRNVNLWTIMGAATDALTSKRAAGGAVAGSLLGPMGAMFGAVMGGLVDRYGPRMARGILDGVANVKGLPTVQKIEAAMNSVSPQAKQEIVDSFRRMILSMPNNEPLALPPHQRAEYRQLLRDSNSLSVIEKADDLSSLNKNGTVKHYVKAVAGGEMKPATPPVRLPNKPAAQPGVKTQESLIKSRRPQDF